MNSTKLHFLNCFLCLLFFGKSYGQDYQTQNTAIIPLLKNCESNLIIYLDDFTKRKFKKTDIEILGGTLLDSRKNPATRRLDIRLIPKGDTITVLANKLPIKKLPAKNLPYPKIEMYVNSKKYDHPGKISHKSTISFKIETDKIEKYLCDCLPEYEISKIKVIQNYHTHIMEVTDYTEGFPIHLKDFITPENCQRVDNENCSGEIFLFKLNGLKRINCDGTKEDLLFKEKDLRFGIEIK